MDIHKGLANANKLMNRVLLEALDHVDLRVAEIHGGGLRNAIPRESRSVVVLAQSDIDALQAALQSFQRHLEGRIRHHRPRSRVGVECC